MAGLNVKGCLIGIPEGDKCVGGANSANGLGEVVNYAGGGYDGTEKKNTAGRWPANLVLDEAAALQLDAQSGKLGIHVPPEVAAALAPGPGERVERLEAGRFWFLDEWEIGGRSSKETKKELEQQE